jgi:hypothetical protein
VTVPIPPDGRSVSAPASITHDCTSDVAHELQSWLDSVPDNSAITLMRDACYRVDETITLRNRHRLLLDGNGALLKVVTTGDRSRQTLVLSGGGDLTVRNLTVRGANPEAGATRSAYHPELEAQHAFQISGASSVLLDHVQASDVYGDFVYVGPSPDKRPSRDVTIANSRFERSGRQGISITDGQGVTIESNAIGEVARSLFDVEPNATWQSTRSIRIVGNVTGASVNFWFADKGAAADVGDIQIIGNRMTAATGGLMWVFARSGAYRGPFVVENNQLIANDAVNDEGSTGAFFFAHADGITIRDNVVRFPDHAAMPAVELRDSHHVQVVANSFTNAGRTVLATADSSDYTVR